MFKLVQILTLQRVLILRVALAAADGQILRGLQIQCRARNNREFTAQAVDDVVGSDVMAACQKCCFCTCRAASEA